MNDWDENLIFKKLKLFISSIEKYYLTMFFYLLHEISIQRGEEINKKKQKNKNKS